MVGLELCGEMDHRNARIKIPFEFKDLKGIVNFVGLNEHIELVYREFEQNQ